MRAFPVFYQAEEHGRIGCNGAADKTNLKKEQFRKKVGGDESKEVPAAAITFVKDALSLGNTKSYTRLALSYSVFNHIPKHTRDHTGKFKKREHFN